jgi:hypothetical protein
MISAQLRRKPSFFWQGLLIVLPVALLAGLGLVSLRQYRRLVEQDATQRAREISEHLSSSVGRRVGNEIAQFTAFVLS